MGEAACDGRRKRRQVINSRPADPSLGLSPSENKLSTTLATRTQPFSSPTSRVRVVMHPPRPGACVPAFDRQRRRRLPPLFPHPPSLPSPASSFSRSLLPSSPPTPPSPSPSILPAAATTNEHGRAHRKGEDGRGPLAVLLGMSCCSRSRSLPLPLSCLLAFEAENARWSIRLVGAGEGADDARRAGRSSGTSRRTGSYCWWSYPGGRFAPSRRRGDPPELWLPTSRLASLGGALVLPGQAVTSSEGGMHPKDAWEWW